MTGLTLWYVGLLAGGLVLVWLVARLYLSFVIESAWSKGSPSVERRYRRLFLQLTGGSLILGICCAYFANLNVLLVCALLYGPLLFCLVLAKLIRIFFRWKDGESEGT